MNTPDEHIDYEGAATASIWWRYVANLKGESAGAIGQLTANSKTAAKAVLERACERLRQQGCQWAIAPLDGDTWHSYRVILESSDEAPFPGEPSLEPHWGEWLTDFGFSIIAKYSSSRVSIGDTEESDSLRRAKLRLEGCGVTIRSMRLDDWDSELARFFEVSLAAFQNAYLYVPLDETGFRALYEKGRALADPRWIRLAECEGKAVGFVFAFRLPGRTALYVKTLAVVPNRRFAGLGTVLLDEVQRAAVMAGSEYAVHCLQHEANTSLRVSSRYQPKVVRTYGLFAKRLGI